MNFGEKLQLLRKARGLSQEALAEQLGVTRQAVSKWELGDATPDLENVVALARFFGVSTDYLLLAAQEEQEEATLQTSAMPRCRDAGYVHRSLGWIGLGTGSLCWLIIWILSTMIQAREAEEVYNAHAGCYEVLTRVSYSFMGFVNTYRLSAILWVTGILAAVGAGLLLYGIWKRRHTKERT